MTNRYERQQNKKFQPMKILTISKYETDCNEPLTLYVTLPPHQDIQKFKTFNVKPLMIEFSL